MSYCKLNCGNDCSTCTRFQPDIHQESAEEDFRSGKSDTPLKKRWYDYND